MSAFDDCTLAEMELVTTTCLNGKTMGDPGVDPLLIAGGLMWITARRTDPTLEWGAFKATVKMGDIKSFSLEMERDELDPTPSRNVLTT